MTTYIGDVEEHLKGLTHDQLVAKLLTQYQRLQMMKDSFAFGQVAGRVNVITIEGMQGQISDRFEGVW